MFEILKVSGGCLEVICMAFLEGVWRGFGGCLDSPVRPGVPNNDQFFNDFGLLIILSNCFFPGWFFKKS